MALVAVLSLGLLGLLGALRDRGAACSASPFDAGTAHAGLGVAREWGASAQDVARVAEFMQAHTVDIGRSVDVEDSVKWHEQDTEHLAGLVRRAANRKGAGDEIDGGRALTEQLEAEISFILATTARLEADPAYSDPDLGFCVYDPVETGWLHALDVAARARQVLLDGGSEAAVLAANDLYRLADGTQLCEADPDGLPRVTDVVRTLRAMDLPREAFEDYRVYLLPLSMGDTSGLGTSEYAIVGAVARRREVIAEQTEVTIAHELGHRIQLARLGPSYWSNPAAWRRYMALRGIAGWSPDGSAASAAWSRSPEETFAEDVRVLFGPDRAAAEPHATVYGDPRADPELAASLREFVFELAAAE